MKMMSTILLNQTKHHTITSNLSTVRPTVQNECNLHEVSVTETLYALFMSLVLFMSLIGNSMVVMAVRKSPGLRRKVTSLFIASLACSDFTYAVFLIPFRITIHLHGTRFCHALSTCYWYLISDAFCNTASILNLLALAMDRYIAIKYPFRYTDVLTRRRSKYVIAAVWLLAAVWSAVGVVKWNTSTDANITVGRLCNNSNKIYYLTSFLGIYITSLLTMTCIHVKILHIAISHIKAIENSHHSRLKRHANNNSIDADKKRLPNRKRRREMKTTKSIAIVYGAFVVCWLPSCIIVLITNFDELALYSLRTRNESAFLFIYYAFIEVLPVLNTAMNPFIYSFSNKQFRAAFSNVISKILMRQRLNREILTTVSSKKKKVSVASTTNEICGLDQLTRTGRVVPSCTRCDKENFSTSNRRRGWSQTSLSSYENHI